MKKTTATATKTSKREERKKIQYLKYAINKRLRQLAAIIIMILGCFYIQLSYTHDILQGTWQLATGMILVTGGAYMLYAVTKEYRFKNSKYRKKYEHLFKKRP